VIAQSETSPYQSIVVGVRAVDGLTGEESAAWDALYAGQRAVSNPFASRAWVSAWYRHFVPPEDRLLLWATEHDRLIGIAPLYRHDLAVGRLSVVRRLRPVGAGRNTPLHLPPLLCAQHAARAVTRALVEFGLSIGVSWVDVCLSREHGWLEAQELIDPNGRGVFAHRQRARTCVLLHLGDTWEETHATLSPTARDEVRRPLDLLARDDRPWAVHHRMGAEVDDQVVERLLRLCTARSLGSRSTGGQPDAFRDRRAAALLRDVVPRLGHDREASVLELELDGYLVAAQLVLHPPGGIYFHVSGLLPSTCDLSPITVLQIDAMRAAVERGDRWAGFSAGPDTSKLRWSDDVATWHDVGVGSVRGRDVARYAAYAVAKDVRELGRELDRGFR
jgi:CelD/BcsL family acetyltransferase involved in cellulose biosynthesis